MKINKPISYEVIYRLIDIDMWLKIWFKKTKLTKQQFIVRNKSEISFYINKNRSLNS